MDMKGFVILSELGGVIKLLSPWYLPFWKLLTTLPNG